MTSMKYLTTLFLVLLAAVTQAETPASTLPVVVFETTEGPIVIEVMTDRAPRSAENFIHYVKAGFYDDTIFHRVIPGFVIQGGGFTEDMIRKPTREPVKNEADNGIKNTRATLSMARTPDPESATSQFFINLSDNTNLDYTEPTAQGWGYAVFARVVEGMDVVDRIADTETGVVEGMPDVPMVPIVITHASVR